MATPKLILSEFAWNERYRVPEIESLLTPALVIYPQIIESNISRTLDLMQGEANRWRAHVKTAKLNYTLRKLVERGVRNFKCATTLELLEACRNGAADVLLAYPVMGANARRAREIADEFPKARIGVLAENEEQVRQWRGSSIRIFLDLNPGMNRTGVEISEVKKILALIQDVHAKGLQFGGLHYYDGQFGGLEEAERTAAAHTGYGRLIELINEIRRSGFDTPEVITAGTPTFPASLSYPHFRDREFLHRVSPGTIVYCDAVSLAQLSSEYGYAPAAMVLTRVVSHPRPGVITCDAGHKSVSADAGVPTCVVMGHPELDPQSPSEEHLPMKVADGHEGPAVGESLLLIPRHVCPTVNNFDCALLVRGGRIEAVEEVSARGREAPLLNKNRVSSLTAQ
jgi:D-serine deaminase-like pyridoxal phosphate-dependent protein